MSKNGETGTLIVTGISKLISDASRIQILDMFVDILLVGEPTESVYNKLFVCFQMGMSNVTVECS